jgi:predicted ATP-grasp superfamily ATP-dependent carboligase
VSVATKPVTLVLDADQRSALAVTRSLGRKGITVFTSDSKPAALAGRSKYSFAYLQSPSAAENPGEFISWLSDTLAQYRIEFLQPVTEISSQLLLQHRDRLPGNCMLPFSRLEDLMSLADKGNLIGLARQAGLRTPATIFVDDPGAFDPAVITAFPVVLKPRLSRIFTGKRWLSTAVAVAQDQGRLRQLLKDRPEFRDHAFLVQEFIPGTGAGVFALYAHGRRLAFFAHKRIREKPPGGGVSVLSESAPVEPALLNASQQLLEHIDWHGVAMVEFRVTPQGEPYLMEVNTRFWGSLQLAIDAGVDFPWLLYEACQGRAVQPPSNGYRIGQRLRWWLGDLDSLYLVLRDPAISTGKKLRRLREFLTPHPFSTRHEVFRWSDPAPAWHELKAYLRALAGR